MKICSKGFDSSLLKQSYSHTRFKIRTQNVSLDKLFACSHIPRSLLGSPLGQWSLLLFGFGCLSQMEDLLSPQYEFPLSSCLDLIPILSWWSLGLTDSSLDVLINPGDELCDHWLLPLSWCLKNTCFMTENFDLNNLARWFVLRGPGADIISGLYDVRNPDKNTPIHHLLVGSLDVQSDVPNGFPWPGTDSPHFNWIFDMDSTYIEFWNRELAFF